MHVTYRRKALERGYAVRPRAGGQGCMQSVQAGKKDAEKGPTRQRLQFPAGYN